MCYWGIKDHLKELTAECWLRVVEFEEKGKGEPQPKVFFPRNLEDTNIEFGGDSLPDNCQSYLADLWKGLDDVKWEQVLMEVPDLLCDQEREILSMR